VGELANCWGVFSAAYSGRLVNGSRAFLFALLASVTVPPRLAHLSSLRAAAA